MQKTTNYNLNKPDGADFYNVEDFNANADVIDAKLKDLEDNSGGVEVEKLTLAEWKARKEAGTLEDGVLYDTIDEIGEDNTLDKFAMKSDLANVDAKTVNGLGFSVDDKGILNITYDDGN